MNFSNGAMDKYFQDYPGTPPIGVRGDYRCSVHYGNTYRLDKAIEQAELPTVDVMDICKYVLEFLEQVGIEIKCFPLVNNPMGINYLSIQRDNELDDLRDIIWMKFTRDGYLGVVATSNDVNFDIPINQKDYNVKIKKYNSYSKKYEYVWKYPTSGILIHQIGKEWDTSFVLLFPLSKLSDKSITRSEIERAVGNYLIDKKVPIIDFYSHNY